jgi:GT2 family glycosyltransferase
MRTEPASGFSSRHIDWRFLLPRPQGNRFDHLILLGGSDEAERMILDLGVARRVSNTLRPGDRADAVIGLAGRDARLGDATQVLGENGVLYWEIDRRRPADFPSAPSRMRRQLRRMGMTLCAAHWVKPGFPDRQMYVPLQCRGALHWYLETLFRSRTRRRRIGRAALAAGADCFGLSTIAPCYAVVAIRGERRLPAVVERAVSHGLKIGADSQIVFLAHGTREWNRIVALLFEPDGTAPVAAIKLPRLERFNSDVEWEHDVLRVLAADLPATIAESIPQSRILRWNGLSVTTETCVTGSSLNSRARPAAETALEDLRCVVNWLAAFHRHSTIERVTAKEWGRQHFTAACRQYVVTFGSTPAEARLFDALSRSIEELGDETLPIVWQHGDLGPPNVYLDNGRPLVIDWESARHGPVLEDLLYLVTDWTAAVTGHRTEAARQCNLRSLYGADRPRLPFLYAVRREVARYMAVVGVPESLFQILLAYTFIRKALECAARLTRLGSPLATVRQDNRFTGYIGVLAERASARALPVNAVSPADVTIAIATLNRPLALRRCADAILGSTALPGELIIVDQSDDGLTAALVAQSDWHSLVPIRYIRQSRQGLAASRNLALRNATRSIVAFTDDDCVPEKGWLWALLAGFNGAERPDAVTGRVLPLGPERPGFYAVSLRESTTAALYSTPTLPWSVGSGGNAAVRRRWLERIGGFDERLGAGSPGRSAEDMDLFHRLLRAGATVRYNPAAVVYHERQDFGRRLASRPAYGFGMGTFCALSAQRRDLYAAWILTRWCGDRMRALAASCVRLRWRRIREECLMLHGAIRGIGHGLTLTGR